MLRRGATVAFTSICAKAVSPPNSLYAGAGRVHLANPTDLDHPPGPTVCADWMADSGLMEDRTAEGTVPAGQQR